jgi:hypothetical protein
MLQKRVVSTRKRTVSNTEYHVNAFVVNFNAFDQGSDEFTTAAPVQLLEPAGRIS